MQAAVDHVHRLLCNTDAPKLPSNLAEVESMHALHADILDLRKHMAMIFDGDLSQDIALRGYLADLLKGHLTNLRHLTRQVEQIAKGDFT